MESEREDSENFMRHAYRMTRPTPPWKATTDRRIWPDGRAGRDERRCGAGGTGGAIDWELAKFASSKGRQGRTRTDHLERGIERTGREKVLPPRVPPRSVSPLRSNVGCGLWDSQSRSSFLSFYAYVVPHCEFSLTRSRRRSQRTWNLAHSGWEIDVRRC